MSNTNEPRPMARRLARSITPTEMKSVSGGSGTATYTYVFGVGGRADVDFARAPQRP